MSPLFFIIVSSIDCSSILSDIICNNAIQCEWDSQLGCICNSIAGLDIIVVMDASGSITPNNFILQKAMLKYIFNGQISHDSRISFIIFASDVNSTSNPCHPLCYWPDGGTTYI